MSVCVLIHLHVTSNTTECQDKITDKVDNTTKGENTKYNAFFTPIHKKYLDFNYMRS